VLLLLLLLQMEPAVSSCLLSAYAALREVNQDTANTQIDKGFQYALAKWWQVKVHARRCCFFDRLSDSNSVFFQPCHVQLLLRKVVSPAL
jgi:hypothetical protein